MDRNKRYRFKQNIFEADIVGNHTYVRPNYAYRSLFSADTDKLFEYFEEIPETEQTSAAKDKTYCLYFKTQSELQSFQKNNPKYKCTMQILYSKGLDFSSANIDLIEATFEVTE